MRTGTLNKWHQTAPVERDWTGCVGAPLALWWGRDREQVLSFKRFGSDRAQPPRVASFLLELNEAVRQKWCKNDML